MAECVRITLIILNVLFLLSSFVMVGFGLATIFSPSFTNSLMVADVAISKTVLRAVGIVTAVGGGWLMLLAFCGIVGASKLSRGCLITYIVFGILSFMINVAATVMAAISNNKSIAKDLTAARLKSKYGVDTYFTEVVDKLQVENLCCGVNGPDDYAKPPMTCCVLKNQRSDDAWTNPQPLDTARCLALDPQFLNTKGCYDTIKKSLRFNNTVSLAITIVVLALNVIALILAFVLCATMKRGN